MSSPSLNLCSLPCGHLPSPFMSLTLIVRIVLMYTHVGLVTSQPIEITKTIKEELLPGTIIANLTSEPEFMKMMKSQLNNDASRDLHYSILTSGNRLSLFFAVNRSTGVVVINRNIDREKVCSFREDCHLNFEVAARSVYGVFFVLLDVTVIILDINDNPPEFTQLQFELNIPENSGSGRSFQLPVAFDRDTGAGNGVREYKILKGPPLFGLNMVETSLNTSDLFLTLVSNIGRESNEPYKVLVGAIDGGLPPLTGTLTVEVHVSDINDNFPIFEQSLYVVSIPEDTRNDQVILQVKANDADTGLNGKLSYSFSAQQPPDDLDYFRIDAETGEIFLTKSIEIRTGEEIDLVVEASDKGHPPKASRSRVRIEIEDTVNSMPDIIIDTLGGAKGVAEVSEYAEIGKVVSHVSVRDPDSGDNGRTKCQISGSQFELVMLDDERKYKAVLMAGLDRELTSMYNVTVSCSDHGFPSLLAREEFVVKVLDENDHSPSFSQRSYQASMYENNTVGFPIVQLTVTDQDIGINAEISFDVLGTNQQYFSIDEKGNVTAKVPLDREYSDKIVATVVATDKGQPPRSASATVIVHLLDINDMRPEFDQLLYRFEVEEGQAVGKYVNIVSASDEDLGDNRKLFYHFPASYDVKKMMFEVEPDSGVIKTKAVLDREKENQFDLIVLATDHGVPPLTGTARLIIQIMDVNDNEPYFIYPMPGNDTIAIPHTFKQHDKIVTVSAHDSDIGLNGQIIYTMSSVNTTSPFSVNSLTGILSLKESLSQSDVGMYFLTISANDQGVKGQRATQAPLYIEVFFDNSTLLATTGAAGPSREMISGLIVGGIVLVVLVTVVLILVCIRRYKAKQKLNGGVPNSASTSSTAKLQGGYYIAPGVKESSSSYRAEEGTINRHVDHGLREGAQTSNPYVVILPQAHSEVPSEIIQISRNGQHHGLNDTLNTADRDHTDDGLFSTFKSQEDILSSGVRQGSLKRQDHDSSIVKRSNDSFGDLSCDDSTSDSGRGGSDVDINNGAAAAKNEKARAQAATPVSIKSGISHRLSPLPREQDRTFVTFRGDSPSSFKFDSDNDTLTRNSQLHTSSLPRRDNPRLETGNVFLGAGRLSESDTDTEIPARNRFQPHIFAGIYSPNAAVTGYNSGVEAGQTRQSIRVGPLPMFMVPSSYHRHDSETDYNDGTSNPSSSLPRRNHVPRLPVYPGIEFSHHAYGASNRNSVGAFSNHSATSNSDGVYPDYDRGGAPNSSNYLSGNYPQSNVPDTRVTNSYNNVMNELQDSRPLSMEEDFLLPPYPEVAEEEEEPLNIHSGYTGLSPDRDGERTALFSTSRFESSA